MHENANQGISLIWFF